MPKLASIYLRTGVLFILVGMTMGLQMAISQDHAIHGAHAHLNLLGFVCSMLFGLFYLLVPEAASSRLAIAQAWLWIPGVAVMIPGVAMAELGHENGAPLAAIGSLMVFVAMLLFAYVVFKATRYSTHTRIRSAQPALWLR